jgi:hypothetical protein
LSRKFPRFGRTHPVELYFHITVLVNEKYIPGLIIKWGQLTYLPSQENDPCLPRRGYIGWFHFSIYSYSKDIKMIYERDPASPFSKIVVKNGSSIVGTIRRNLITGHYHFCDNQLGGLNCMFQEKRIDSIKTRIEELHDLPKAS